MSETKNDVIYSSLEYGAYKIETNQYDNEISGKTYDICDELGSKILDYRLKKISYILNSNQYIEKIKLEYINKSDGSSKILETPTWENSPTQIEEFELEDDEEITKIKVYLKDIKLLGFEIFTNKGKNKKIGFGEESEANVENALEKGDKLIVGFGFNSSSKYGVYCMHFYYVDKN